MSLYFTPRETRRSQSGYLLASLPAQSSCSWSLAAWSSWSCSLVGADNRWGEAVLQSNTWENIEQEGRFILAYSLRCYSPHSAGSIVYGPVVRWNVTVEEYRRAQMFTSWVTHRQDTAPKNILQKFASFKPAPPSKSLPFPMIAWCYSHYKSLNRLWSLCGPISFL